MFTEVELSQISACLSLSKLQLNKGEKKDDIEIIKVEKHWKNIEDKKDYLNKKNNLLATYINIEKKFYKMKDAINYSRNAEKANEIKKQYIDLFALLESHFKVLSDYKRFETELPDELKSKINMNKKYEKNEQIKCIIK